MVGEAVDVVGFPMTNFESHDCIEAWLASRPECVQKLFAEFPPESKVRVGNEYFYVLGYTENDEIIITLHNPGEDYDAAINDQRFVCAKHLRGKVS